jgi:hypothetical protein
MTSSWTRPRAVASLAALASLVFAVSDVAAAPAAPAPRARVAIGLLGETPGSGELTADVLVRAAGQGARDACLDPATGKFREPSACVRPAPGAPAGVCDEVTVAAATSPMVACAAADPAVAVIELGSSVCGSAECLKSDALAAGATHLIVVGVGSAVAGEGLGADLVDLASDAATTRRARDYFPEAERAEAATIARTPGQTAAIVHAMARDLVADRFGERLRASLPPAAALVAPPPAPRAPPEPHWEAWALAGGGTALGIAGVVLWALDGRAQGCSNLGPGDACPDIWDTRKIGIPLVVGGALAAGAGIWLMLLPPHDTYVGLAPTGNGLSLIGKF